MASALQLSIRSHDQICQWPSRSKENFGSSRSYAMAILKRGYRESVKRNMPRQWFDPIPHTHRTLDDAIEQGALFCNMLAYRPD